MNYSFCASQLGFQFLYSTLAFDYTSTENVLVVFHFYVLEEKCVDGFVTPNCYAREIWFDIFRDNRVFGD